MRRASLFPGLLLLGLTIASPVGASNATTGNAVGAEAVLEAREAAVSQREAELVRREATRELRAEIEDAANGRLEVIGGWLGALIGLFGIAVTIATLIVTFRTPAVAAQAARDTAHKAVAEEKAKIEALVEQIIAIGERAKTTDAELSTILDRHKAGQPVDQPGERATIEAAAEAARIKLPSARTADDLRALIVASRIAGDWTAMRDHARALLYFYGDDRDAQRTAYFNLAFALDELQRYEDAIAALDQLILSYPDECYESLFASGLNNKGVALGKLGRSEEAIAIYDEMIRRFHDSDVPRLRAQVAGAMYNKGVRLRNLQKTEDAIAVYDTLIRQFDNSNDPMLQMHVAKAVFNRGMDLSSLGRGDEEIAAYDEVIRRIGDSEDPDLQELVGKSLYNKGVELNALDQQDAALATYGELIRRFGKSELPKQREQVTKALFNTARLHARGADGEAAVDTLRQWSRHRDGFDCEAVAKNPDFDAIRKEPQFVALLAEMGCAPRAKKRAPRRKPA